MNKWIKLRKGNSAFRIGAGPKRRSKKDFLADRSPHYLRYIKKCYEDGEAINDHVGNYLMLASLFGTEKEVYAVVEIKIRTDKNGSLDHDDNKWLFENINPYYDIIKEVDTSYE